MSTTSPTLCETPAAVRIHSAQGRVRVEADALFSPADDSHLMELIVRLFRLDAVRSVNVDRRHHWVVIDYDGRLLPASTALQSFSRALQESGSLPVLRRLLQNRCAPIRRVERRREAASDGFIVRDEPAGIVRGATSRLTGLHHERIERAVNLALGIGCFGMSIVGIMTPFVPTMPFVLATGYFLANSSSRLHDLFRRSPLFGEMLCEWEEYAGWSFATKRKLFILMGGLWVLTLGLAGFSWALVAVMGLMSGISVMTILRIPTVPGAAMPTAPSSIRQCFPA